MAPVTGLINLALESGRLRDHQHHKKDPIRHGFSALGESVGITYRRLDYGVETRTAGVPAPLFTLQ